MIRNRNPRGSTCSGIQTEIPLWGVNIRRNVSRIKRLEALYSSEIIPDSGSQHAPEYPIVKRTICFPNTPQKPKLHLVGSFQGYTFRICGFLRALCLPSAVQTCRKDLFSIAVLDFSTNLFNNKVRWPYSPLREIQKKSPLP